MNAGTRPRAQRCSSSGLKRHALERLATGRRPTRRRCSWLTEEPEPVREAQKGRGRPVTGDRRPPQCDQGFACRAAGGRHERTPSCGDTCDATSGGRREAVVQVGGVIGGDADADGHLR